MNRFAKAKALERHANEYVEAFDSGQVDNWLLERATELLNQADRIRKGVDNVRIKTVQRLG